MSYRHYIYVEEEKLSTANLVWSQSNPQNAHNLVQ